MQMNINFVVSEFVLNMCVSQVEDFLYIKAEVNKLKKQYFE